MRMNDKQLAEEAKAWSDGTKKPTDPEWYDAPSAVPRYRESERVELRLPIIMVKILKEFARRENIGWHMLMKRWLDDRIREEAQKFKDSTQE